MDMILQHKKGYDEANKWVSVGEVTLDQQQMVEMPQ